MFYCNQGQEVSLPVSNRLPLFYELVNDPGKSIEIYHRHLQSLRNLCIIQECRNVYYFFYK